MNKILGMNKEIAERHATLRSFEEIIELAEKESREPTEVEISEAMEQEGNFLRIRAIPKELCKTRNISNEDEEGISDRIDERYIRTDTVPLICNACGAIFSTKNIDKIGARSIFPFFGNREVYTCYVLLAETCNHSTNELRLPTDDEFIYLQGIEKRRK